MKKLLVGLFALGSFSILAGQCDIQVKGNGDFGPMATSEAIMDKLKSKGFVVVENYGQYEISEITKSVNTNDYDNVKKHTTVIKIDKLTEEKPIVLLKAQATTRPFIINSNGSPNGLKTRSSIRAERRFIRKLRKLKDCSL